MSNGTLEWSGSDAQPRSPRFCTWALRWPALVPTLKRPLGASKQRPGRFRGSHGVVIFLNPSAMNIGTDIGTIIRQQHSGMIRRDHPELQLTPTQWHATPLVQCRYPALQSFLCTHIYIYIYYIYIYIYIFTNIYIYMVLYI